MQNWRKVGMVFCPSNNYDWMVSHASVPFAENLSGDMFKVFFSSRDANDESSIGFVVFDIHKPNVILDISSKPVISKGELGAFDDSGCMGSCLVNYNDKKLLYYIGWNLGKTVPFRNSIGLAISEDGINYRKAYYGPIIDRTKDEPHFVASNCVVIDNDIFKIWYLSCTGWKSRNGVVTHEYHIKYAESKDGINWTRNGDVAIDFANEYEYAISVPRVIKEDGLYKMWFSSRGSKGAATYRIRYAESNDGMQWNRRDNLVRLNVSKKGWDSEMIESPFVFDHVGQRYMLYNGNGYGETGFGLAVLEQG
ncbi:MAG TPA: hypothetical protein EYN69_06165 [Flavobacteriales bacterium]|nr:hypothetical protein [Flavobacteriales bacterium]